MNTNSLNAFLLALVSAMVLLVSPVWSQLPQTQRGVELEIERIKKSLEEERTLWDEEKTKETEAEKKREERYRLAQEDKQKNANRVHQLDRDIAQAALQLEAQEKEYKSLEKKMTYLGESLLPHVEKLEASLAKDFPHEKKKRLEKVRLLISDIKKEKVSPEETFSRLWQIYQAESQLAASAEIFSGEVSDESGRSRSVKFLRVGKQVLAYADGTGDLVGVQRQLDNGNWEWVRQDELSYRGRQAIRKAVAVGEGKETPGFVAVPFWIQAQGEEK